MCLERVREEIFTEFRWANPVKSVYLEDQEVDERHMNLTEDNVAWQALIWTALHLRDLVPQ